MTESRNIYLALVPVLDDSQPNFRPAAWRAIRSTERLQQVVEAIPNLSAEWKGYPVARAEKHRPDQIRLELVDWNWSHMPTARVLTMLSSEVLHHARIALDYCAYHVVWKDGGAPREKTKFPLVTKLENWGKEKRGSLPGISDIHANWIRDVQPFNGVEWSVAMEKLSNRDKHRLAVDVLPTYRCRVDLAKRYADPLGDTGYVGYAVEDGSLELAIAPAAGEGSGNSYPLEKTLVSIVSGTVAVVNRFLVEAGHDEIALDVRLADKGNTPSP